MEKKLLYSFEKQIRISLTPDERQEAMKALNLYYLGDENPNEWKNGVLVPKYKEKETKEFLDSHYAICRSHETTIVVKVYSDGTFEIVPKK